MQSLNTPMKYLQNWRYEYKILLVYCMLFAFSMKAVSLLVAGICHDLEHPGKNNTFMVQSGDPIAILYSSSPLEKHHFNQACLILQDKQNDIFSNLESEKPKARK